MLVHSWIAGLLALTVAASPLQETEIIKRQSISSTQLDDFKIYAQYAAATYCNGLNSPGQLITCGGNACNNVGANRAVTVASFSGSTTGIQGFVATDPVRREIILSIRGSSNVRNWITNFQFSKVSCPLVSGCEVHRGFLSAWNEIEDAANAAIRQARSRNPTFRLVTTGHSLGGAVATLAAAYIRAAGTPSQLYTYGSPRVGNAEFVEFVSRQAGGNNRVTHGADPVPRVPPFAVGYRHTTPEYWLNGGLSSTRINYGTSDIRVCAGILNLACNAGRVFPDVVSHLYYVNNMAGCTPVGFDVRLDSADMNEAEDAFDRLAEIDRQFMIENNMGNDTVVA